MAYTLVLPALTQQEREQYLAESRLFATLFGIPQVSLPNSWVAFSDYIDAMVQSHELAVTDKARAMAHRLLAGTDVWFPVPASYRALTAGLLPPRLREAFALQFGEPERKAAENLVTWLRRSYPFLPQYLRYVGPYLGDMRIGLITQMCNRFWIGRPQMPRQKHAHG